MANTYTLIKNSTVGSGGTANIEFTSIPATYTDLLISFSIRTVNGGSRDDIKITVNSDTGSNYSARRVYGGDGNAASQSSSGTPSDLNIGAATASTATSNTFASLQFYIPNYTSNKYKSISCNWTLEDDRIDAHMIGTTAILWSNTSAVTSFKIESKGANNFVQHSTAYLYGIKNS